MYFSARYRQTGKPFFLYVLRRCFPSIITDKTFTGLYYTSNTTGVSEEAGTVYPSREQDLPCFVFGRVRVAHLFSFLCCVSCFVNVILCSLPDVDSVSRFPILDSPFGFLLHVFKPGIRLRLSN